jgi:hypothetical protein
MKMSVFYETLCEHLEYEDIDVYIFYLIFNI